MPEVWACLQNIRYKVLIFTLHDLAAIFPKGSLFVTIFFPVKHIPSKTGISLKACHDTVKKTTTKESGYFLPCHKRDSSELESELGQLKPLLKPHPSFHILSHWTRAMIALKWSPEKAAKQGNVIPYSRCKTWPKPLAAMFLMNQDVLDDLRSSRPKCNFCQFILKFDKLFLSKTNARLVAMFFNQP